MNRFFVFTVLFLLLLGSVAFAQEEKSASGLMMRPPYAACFNTEDFNKFFGSMQFDEAGMRHCVEIAFPRSATECEGIPARYAAEFRQDCLAKGMYCDKISLPDIKQKCEKQKADNNSKTMYASILSFAVALIPFAVLILLVVFLFLLFTKKLSKNKARLLLLAMAALIVILFAIIAFSPCIYPYCVY